MTRRDGRSTGNGGKKEKMGNQVGIIHPRESWPPRGVEMMLRLM